MASPPSPEDDEEAPVPAIVVMIPVAAVIFLMRKLPESTKYKFPALSNATPAGSFNWADVAAPPSPLKPEDVAAI